MDDLQSIKNRAFINVVDNLIPEEGYINTVRGGKGNMVLDQRKKEEGVYYRRNNEEDEWVEYDAHKEMLDFIRSLNEN